MSKTNRTTKKLRKPLRLAYNIPITVICLYIFGNEEKQYIRNNNNPLATNVINCQFFKSLSNLKYHAVC